MPSHNDNISVLPATSLLHLAEMERAIRMLTPADLRTRLSAGTPPDVVVIDCGPGLGIMGLAAIAAADLIIVPVTLDLLAVMGLERTLEVVAECAPETPFQILLNPIHGDGDPLIEDRVRRRYGAHVVKHRLQPLAPPRTALPGVQ